MITVQNVLFRNVWIKNKQLLSIEDNIFYLKTTCRIFGTFNKPVF